MAWSFTLLSSFLVHQFQLALACSELPLVTHYLCVLGNLDSSSSKSGRCTTKAVWNHARSEHCQARLEHHTGYAVLLCMRRGLLCGVTPTETFLVHLSKQNCTGQNFRFVLHIYINHKKSAHCQLKSRRHPAVRRKAHAACATNRHAALTPSHPLKPHQSQAHNN